MTRTYMHGKFDTSTRRGKATVSGNTVYVTVDNFKKYANAKAFFCYEHDIDVQENKNNNVTTANYTRYVKVNTRLNVRSGPGINYNIVEKLKNGTKVKVYESKDNWSRIDSNKWVNSNYLSEVRSSITTTTIGSIKKLSKSSILYSNSNLSGKKYNYKVNTTITILQNVSSTIDKVRVNATGRVAYINNSNYKETAVSTKNKSRKIKSCTLYSKSNLTGTKYQYRNNTTVTIIQNISNKVDKVRVNVTGRVAYIDVNNYK